MRRKPSAQTASIGVTRTQLAVESELGWLFREQPTEDYGIDAQIEVVDGNVVEGRLLALQIKSGKSWFKEPGLDGWWYRPDADHVHYWLNHSLPVVIVLVHAETNICHWQLVSRATLTETSGGGWKMLVPEANRLDETAREDLQEAAAGDPYALRLRDLQLARSWMERLAAGQRLVVDIEEWVNKTSGRGSITLGIDNEDGNDPEPLASWGVFLGLSSYAEVVPRLFAWADVSLHEQTYEDADYAEYETECVIVDEGDTITTRGFGEWLADSRPDGLRPYDNAAGEVDYWRLELTLNGLGRAFLTVDEFATQGPPQLTP